MSDSGTNRAVKITFDGGSLGNPGKGYGSYRSDGIQAQPRIVRLDFSPNGERVSNNQAEYRTLIAALTELSEYGDPPAPEINLEICGDSMLVIEQLAGRWKVKHPAIRPLRDAAARLLTEFGSVTLRWHGRAKSVEILGH